MRLLPRIGLAVAALALVLGTAVPARAAVLWTLTASPLTVNAGVQTTFRLRASLTLLGEIRCVEVGVPSNFLVTGSAVTGSNAGNSWVSQVVGNDVFVRTTSGGDRLENPGHYVEFTITATAWTAGSLAWASHTHDREDCTGPESLLSVPPIVLVLGSAAPTPTPVPTVAPTPAPTATPRPTALPSLLPTLPPITLPSLPPITILPTPRPSSPVVTAEPSGPASPAPTPSGRTSPDAEATAPPSATPVPHGDPSSTAPDATPGEAGVGPADPPSGGGGTPAGRILAEPPSTGRSGEPAPVPIALGALGLLGSIDIWIVPGLLLGVPGLLVVAFVVLQAVGALAWIPAIRRLRGDDPEPAAA